MLVLIANSFLGHWLWICPPRLMVGSLVDMYQKFLYFWNPWTGVFNISQFHLTLRFIFTFWIFITIAISLFHFHFSKTINWNYVFVTVTNFSKFLFSSSNLWFFTSFSSIHKLLSQLHTTFFNVTEKCYEPPYETLTKSRTVLLLTKKITRVSFAFILVICLANLIN